jgi:hypothetical protein
MEKFEMEKFEAPIELDDVELDAVAGGILNDINFVVGVAAVLNSDDSIARVRITDNSTSDASTTP